MPQTPPKNYYQSLELENFADIEQVKSAFRRLARQYHPDLNAGSKTQEERFKLINEAYEVLGSADKKAGYDDSMRIILKIPQPGKTAASNNQSASAAYQKQGTFKQKPESQAKQQNNNDFFETVRKAFAGQDADKSTRYKTQQTSGQRQQGKPKRGQDISVEATISYQEAIEGVIKTVNVQQQDFCKRCSGTGKVTGKACSVCHGEKYLIRHKKIDVKIPAGVKSGSKVRVAAEGAKGEAGAEAGDLFLQIQVAAQAKPDHSEHRASEHSRAAETKTPDEYRQSLRIEGLDVYGEVFISIPEAVLGTTLNIPTITGHVRLSIPALSSSGRVLRLKEQGVHSGGEKGDYYVTLKISMPDSISPKEKELYQELLKLELQRKNKP